ncbi:MAG: hypothetical protein M3Y57_15450 [Acidobacteriota bacterium]|nr:hypothetical protein [Acidobacteriota bacterium]
MSNRSPATDSATVILVSGNFKAERLSQVAPKPGKAQAAINGKANAPNIA